MKTHFQAIGFSHSIRFFAALVMAAAMGIGNLQAYNDTNSDGSINTGRASIFTVLTNGDLTMSGSSSITGTTGVGDSGSANLSGSARINGNLIINKKGKYNHTGTSGVTGTVTTDQTTLDNAWADALSLAGAAGSEMATNNYTYTVNGNPGSVPLTNVNLSSSGQITLVGGLDQKIVLSLQNFTLDQHSTFTLQGTATTTFIINVAKTFSLDHGSTIALLGVPPANVLFNLKGDGKLSGGAQMSGILLASKGTVTLSGSSGGVGSGVTGKIIAKQVTMSDGANVKPITPVMNP